VNAAEVAMPLALVVAVFALPANVPLAPELGAANVTTTPLTGTPAAVTVATSEAANAVLTAALCGVPLVVATVAAAGVVLVVVEFAPQAVRKLIARTTKTKTRMLLYSLRFIASLLQFCASDVHA
jgi:hypothetical protein